MTRVVSRIFDSYAQARSAVAALEEAGFTTAEISLVSRYRDDDTLLDEAADRTSATTAGAAAGAILGGGTGLLAALGIIAIPGIGPLVAAGVLATTLTGAAGGSLVGGLVGALTGYGISEEDAHVYSEGLRRGGSLVSVTTGDQKASRADAILAAHSPVNVDERRQDYRTQGWSTYDPASKGYTAEEIRRERERYLRK